MRLCAPEFIYRGREIARNLLRNVKSLPRKSVKVGFGKIESAAQRNENGDLSVPPEEENEQFRRL